MVIFNTSYFSNFSTLFAVFNQMYKNFNLYITTFMYC